MRGGSSVPLQRGRILGAGGIQPVTGVRASTGSRVVVGGLVPFVLVGHPKPRGGCPRRRQCAGSQIVGAGFGICASFAVVEPVGEAHRIGEGDKDYRKPFRIWERLIPVVAFGSGALKNRGVQGHQTGIRHGRLPKTVGIPGGNVVEKFGVLSDGDLEPADIKRVSDRTVPGGVRWVSGITDADPVRLHGVVCACVPESRETEGEGADESCSARSRRPAWKWRRARGRKRHCKLHASPSVAICRFFFLDFVFKKLRQTQRSAEACQQSL